MDGMSQRERDNFVGLRRYHGLKQKDAARAFGITRVALANWETGRSKVPRGPWIMKLQAMVREWERQAADRAHLEDAPFDRVSRACPNCGMRVVRCAVCGELARLDRPFCSACGGPLRDESWDGGDGGDGGDGAE